MGRTFQVWPAMDLRGGCCVRLVQGDFHRETVFSTDPVAMARQWKERGVRRLHIVDLDAARRGTPVHQNLVRQIVEQLNLPIQLGGGIRNEEILQQWLDAGVFRLVIGTRAVRDPEWFRLMCRRYPGRLALGLDARDGWVAVDGWQNTTSISAVELVKQFCDEPLAAVIYTDIARDGTLSGPSFDAIEALCRVSAAPVIASGGVSTLEDVRRLASLPVGGCIVGRALYEGTLPWEELQPWDDPQPSGHSPLSPHPV